MTFLASLFHLHKWKYVHVENYLDFSYSNPGESGSPSHTWTRKCTECGQVQSKNIFGGRTITLEELNS